MAVATRMGSKFSGWISAKPIFENFLENIRPDHECRSWEQANLESPTTKFTSHAPTAESELRHAIQRLRRSTPLVSLCLITHSAAWRCDVLWTSSRRSRRIWSSGAGRTQAASSAATAIRSRTRPTAATAAPTAAAASWRRRSAAQSPLVNRCRRLRYEWSCGQPGSDQDGRGQDDRLGLFTLYT